MIKSSNLVRVLEASFTCVVLLGVLLTCGSKGVYGRQYLTGTDSVRYRDTLVSQWTPIEHRPLQAGVFGGAAFDQLTLQSASSPLVSTCDFFTSGTGTTPYFGAEATIPFWGDLAPWSVTPRLGFLRTAGTFVWTELDSVRVGSVVSGHHFEHQLTTSVSAITVATLFNWRPAGALQFSVGPEIAVQFHSKFSREVDAVEPGDLVNGSRANIEATGSLPSMRLLGAAIEANASYEIPLSQKLWASPEVGLRIPITSLSPNLRSFDFHAGLAVQLDLTPRREFIETYVRRRVAIPVVVETPKPPGLSASIEAFGISRTGDTSRVLTISIQELRSRSAYPILNYIFFNDGESSLPSRYVVYRSPEEAHAQFRGSDERHDIKLLALYRETLNLIGERLARLTNTTVQLTGCISNTGAEQNRIDLARARAETVKQYLVNVWKIDPKRITIVARGLPEHPSPTTLERGSEENRRVEIEASDPAIVDPVIVLNTERVATPPNIVIVPHIFADTSIVAMHTALSGAGRELLSSSFGPNAERARKVWRLDEDVLDQLTDSLRLTLDVKDAAGSEAHAASSIPLAISRLTAEKREALDRFSLILFGFDEANLGTKNKRVLGRIVGTLSTLSANQLSVVGYTDEMGDPSHNDALSDARAKAAAGEIGDLMQRMKLPPLERVVTEGRGSREVLYDNTLPEGRFFSRTVNVTIEGISR